MKEYEPGSIRTYLMQMGDIPLLSRSEELAAARQIRQDPPPAAARHVVLGLHPSGGDRRAGRSPERQAAVGAGDRVVGRTIPRKGRITQLLETNCRTLGQLLRANQSDFRIAIGHRKHSPDDRRAARRRLAGCRRRAAALIEEVAVRMPRLQSALNSLRQISQRMTAVAVLRAKVQSVAGEERQIEALRKEMTLPDAGHAGNPCQLAPPFGTDRGDEPRA